MAVARRTKDEKITRYLSERQMLPPFVLRRPSSELTPTAVPFAAHPDSQVKAGNR